MTNETTPAPAAAAGVPSTRVSQGRRQEQLENFGLELLAATETLVPVAPLRNRLEGMTLADAYYIQTIQLDHHLAAGRVLAGRKVGLTSLAMQQQLGVDSPDFGFFFDDIIDS